jgi:hypothetical protein
MGRVGTNLHPKTLKRFDRRSKPALGDRERPAVLGAAGFARVPLMFERARRPGRPRSQTGQTARVDNPSREK